MGGRASDEEEQDRSVPERADDWRPKEWRRTAPEPGGKPTGDHPDVHLDVSQLKIDEINLEVADLRAHVSLKAEVLDLVKLNVGADVALGRVSLGIKGVEAQALLEVRLHNVAAIIQDVLRTIDRNPQILEHLTMRLGAATEEIGRGTGTAAGQLGRGAGEAAEEVGRGAGQATENVGRGAGQATENVGRGAGQATENVGTGAGRAVEDTGAGAVEGVTKAAGDVGAEARGTVDEVGEGTSTVKSTAEDTSRGRDAPADRRPPDREPPRRSASDQSDREDG